MGLGKYIIKLAKNVLGHSIPLLLLFGWGWTAMAGAPPIVEYILSDDGA